METDKYLNEVIYDKRGFAVFTKIKGKKSMLAYTKKGELRGGDYHNVDQLFYLLKGSVQYKIIYKDEGVERWVILKPKQSIIARAGNPHMIRALTDCIFLEVFLGKDTRTFYYKPYRKLVKK